MVDAQFDATHLLALVGRFESSPLGAILNSGVQNTVRIEGKAQIERAKQSDQKAFDSL